MFMVYLRILALGQILSYINIYANRDNNIYNQACKYADEREEGCI